MNYEFLVTLVKEWGEARGIASGDPAQQIPKLCEEVAELQAGFQNQDLIEILDALGDIQVVMIMIHARMGLDPAKTLEAAYNEIKDRKGRTENGIFIKEGV